MYPGIQREVRGLPGQKPPGHVSPRGLEILDSFAPMAPISASLLSLFVSLCLWLLYILANLISLLHCDS